MALIIEDGSGVDGANSYASVAEARSYATSRGLTLPVADADVEKLLVKATDYLESAPAGPWKGERAYAALESLSWPRKDVIADGYTIGQDEIPLNLKKAQIQAAFELQTVDPTPVISGSLVKREKVDVLETEYAIDYKTGQKLPVFTKVNRLLLPLVKGGGTLRLNRI